MGHVTDGPSIPCWRVRRRLTTTARSATKISEGAVRKESCVTLLRVLLGAILLSLLLARPVLGRARPRGMPP